MVYKLVKNNGKFVVKLSIGISYLSLGKKVFPGEKSIYRIKNE